VKLYYSPYACSLASHIVLRELALPFELVRVNNQTKQTSDGRDFRTINPKGYVAALELDDGQVLTEGIAIVQYLAELRPEKELTPPAGSWARVRLQEWLAFLASEIHAGAAPLFKNATISEDARDYFRERLYKRFDYLEGVLAERQYLQGNTFSVADAYLFTLLGWDKFLSIDLDRWSALTRYKTHIGQRPAVLEALQAEAET
jgi:glutathione S-transferase